MNVVTFIIFSQGVSHLIESALLSRVRHDTDEQNAWIHRPERIIELVKIVSMWLLLAGFLGKTEALKTYAWKGLCAICPPIVLSCVLHLYWQKKTGLYSLLYISHFDPGHCEF